MRFAALPTRFFAVICLVFVAAAVPAEAQKRKSNIRIADTSIVEVAPLETAIEPEANPAADIDQCHNGGVGDPVQPCVGGQWVNGNANGNQAHYQEGDYIHYRLKFTNLVVNETYTVKIGYDILKNGKHAIDYLGTYNKDFRLDPDSPGIADYPVEPCLAGTNCATTFTSQIGVPVDPALTAAGVFQEPGVFTMWGGEFISVTGYSMEDAETQSLSITFRALTTNPVMAWGGHIAWAGDWGGNNTATAGDINGSPYHMRLISNGTFNGQQDRQLSVSAIITTVPTAAPASVTGRVTDRYGRGISAARVQIFDVSTGEVRSAYSNSFGYYRFDELEVGNAYVASVAHKRYLFMGGTTTFTLEGDLAGVDFVAN